jgi:hypothetical protein
MRNRLNELAQLYGYTFSESVHTSHGHTNMYKDGIILLGNASYQKCINFIKSREGLTKVSK